MHICHLFTQVYSRLDQPLTALNVFKQGLDRFPGEVSLLCGIARIYEVREPSYQLTEGISTPIVALKNSLDRFPAFSNANWIMLQKKKIQLRWLCYGGAAFPSSKTKLHTVKGGCSSWKLMILGLPYAVLAFFSLKATNVFVAKPLSAGLTSISLFRSALHQQGE